MIVNIRNKSVDKFFLMLTILSLLMICQHIFVDKNVDMLTLVVTLLTKKFVNKYNFHS